MKYLKALLLLGILVFVFSCGKDDEDMGGSNQKSCTLQSIYKDGVLFESYVIQTENTYRRNFFNEAGVLIEYFIYTKDSQGNVTRRTHFDAAGTFLKYTQYLYFENVDEPHSLEDYVVIGVDTTYSGGLDISASFDDCGRERLGILNSDHFTFLYIDYAYLDENCSYAYRGYFIDSNTLEEELLYERERIYDSRNAPWLAFTEYGPKDGHNTLSVTNKDGDVLERSSVYQYNEEGYPTNEERSILQNDGSIILTIYTYEYLCE